MMIVVNFVNVIGFIGAALLVTSFLMKSMLPLRLVALAANVCLLIFALNVQSWPSVLIYIAMIPLNLLKVREIRKMVAAMERARTETPLADWLLPHMTRREAAAGQTLWSKGDEAKEMVYVHSGRLNLQEHGETLGPGSLVGEIGLFSPDHKRTGTITCETDCTLYALSSEAMARLYFVNPKLGYHLMRLVVARLLRDTDRARESGLAPAA